MELDEEKKILPSGEAIVKAGLLGQQSDPTPKLLAIGPDRMPEDKGIPRRGREQARQHPNGGGFASPVRSKQTEDFSGCNREIESVHRVAVSKTLT
jgi:hypothetical protein